MADEIKPIPVKGAGTRGETLGSMCTTLFRGKLAWLAIVGCVYGAIFLALTIFSAIMFFRVDSTRYMIFYAVIFAVSATFMALTEMWFWAMGFRKTIAIRLDRIESRLAETETMVAEHPEATGHAA